MGSVGYLSLGPIPPFEPNLASVIMGLMITGLAGSIPWVILIVHSIFSKIGPNLELGRAGEADLFTR